MHVTFPKATPMPSAEVIRIFNELDADIQAKNGDFNIPLDVALMALPLIGRETGLVLEPVPYVHGAGYQVGHVGLVPNLRGAKAPYTFYFGNSEHRWPFLGLPAQRFSDNERYNKDRARFEFLADYFMQPDNLELLASAGREIPIRDYGKYDY